MKEFYLGQISQGETPPFKYKPVSSESELNETPLRLVSDVVAILKGEGIEPILIGSSSVLLHTDKTFPHKIHDADFLIEEKVVEGVRRALVGKGFNFWDENRMHAGVRNLTGGFGRHHNFGASSEKYLGDTGLPIWMGFFTYSDKMEIKEKYAFSRFKLNCAIESALQTIGDADPAVRQRLAELTETRELRMQGFLEILDLLDREGIIFWDIMDAPEINNRDIARRQALKPNTTEQFIEVSRRETYNVAVGDYMRLQTHGVFGTDAKVVDLATTYWRMKRYFPHYLGSREKYVRSANFMEESGRLTEDTQVRENIYKDREIYVSPTGVFLFKNDLCFDYQTMKKGNNGRNEPNYWTLLLEGVHYVTNK